MTLDGNGSGRRFCDKAEPRQEERIPNAFEWHGEGFGAKAPARTIPARIIPL
jgi:hypothetical protein